MVAVEQFMERGTSVAFALIMICVHPARTREYTLCIKWLPSEIHKVFTLFMYNNDFLFAPLTLPPSLSPFRSRSASP